MHRVYVRVCVIHILSFVLIFWLLLVCRCDVYGGGVALDADANVCIRGGLLQQ